MPQTAPLTLDQVSRRLLFLEEERAVIAALYRYSHTIDYGPIDEIIDCFTADGAFDVHMRSDPAASDSL